MALYYLRSYRYWIFSFSIFFRIQSYCYNSISIEDFCNPLIAIELLEMLNSLYQEEARKIYSILVNRMNTLSGQQQGTNQNQVLSLKYYCTIPWQDYRSFKHRIYCFYCISLISESSISRGYRNGS